MSLFQTILKSNSSPELSAADAVCGLTFQGARTLKSFPFALSGNSPHVDPASELQCTKYCELVVVSAISIAHLMHRARSFLRSSF